MVKDPEGAGADVKESIDEDNEGSMAGTIGEIEIEGWHFTFMEVGGSSPATLMMQHLC